jgi:hypothetical protein
LSNFILQGESAEVGTGTYGGTWTIRGRLGGGADQVFDFVGNPTFTGNVTYTSLNSSNTWTINNSGNYTVEHQGAVAFNEPAGTVVLTEGTGTFEFSGTASTNFTDTSAAGVGSLGSILYSKTAGGLTLQNDIEGTGLSFGAASAGTLNANGNDVTLGSSGLDCTNAGGAILTLGNGTWVCSGIWDVDDVGTFNGNQALVQLTGTADIRSDTGTTLYDLEISGTITLPNIDQRQYINNSLTIKNGGELINNEASSYGLYLSAGTLTVEATGTLSGTGYCRTENSTVNNSAGGSWTIANTIFQRASNIQGVFGGVVLCINEHTGVDYTLTFGGATTFNGTSVTFNADTTRTYTLDNSGNYTITCQGDVTFSETGGGALAITEGTGGWQLTGTANQTVTNSAALDNIGDLLTDKTAGRVTLASSIFCQAFQFDDGDFDLAGFTVTAEGNVDVNGGVGLARFWNGVDEDMANGKFVVGNGGASAGTLDGTAGQQLVIDNLDFDLQNSSTLTATYCDIGTSDVTNGTGDATDASNSNDGGNSGWNFAAAGGKTIFNLSPTPAANDTWEVAP